MIHIRMTLAAFHALFERDDVAFSQGLRAQALELLAAFAQFTVKLRALLRQAPNGGGGALTGPPRGRGIVPPTSLCQDIYLPGR